MPDGTATLLAQRYRTAPLRDLAPYTRNSKIHTGEQIAALEASLLEFGWTRPIAQADGTILAGHGVVTAALNLAERGQCPRWWPDATLAPILDLSHLNEDQRRAYVIADNRLAEKGTGWDEEMLVMELGELHEAGFDLGPIGYDEADLARILASRSPQVDPAEEWQGMPEFEQDDQTAFRTIKVHFQDQEAVNAFSALIGQAFTDRTKFVWYPEIARENYAGKRYVSDAAPDDDDDDHGEQP